MASTAFTAARLYRRAGEPGHRVCRCALAGAVLRTIAVHLGDADRSDLDLPDDRVLRRRPPGRPPPGRETALSVGRGSCPAYRGHPDRVATGPFAGPYRLRGAVRLHGSWVECMR